MNVPGFTAESSLYRTSGRYQMTVGFDSNTMAVVAAVGTGWATAGVFLLMRQGDRSEVS
jgi:hypothetical protein